MPREELKNKLGLQPKQFNAFCEYLVSISGVLRTSAEVIAVCDFQPRFTEMQRKQVDTLLAFFDKQPYMPPAVKECISQVGEETYHALLTGGILRQVTDEVVFTSGVFNKIIADIMQILRENNTATLAQVRDNFQTSRKYALAVLEYMDSNGLTVRDGDNRRLADPHE
jgi:selenocysteine-specific elongation factor